MKTSFFTLVILTFLFSCQNKTEESNPLEGKWQVIYTNISPFDHQFICGKLDTNTIYNFKKDKSFEIITNDPNANCFKDSTIYYSDTNYIYFNRLDVVSKTKIIKYSKDTLKLLVGWETGKFYKGETKLAPGKNWLDINKEGHQIIIAKTKNGG